MRVFETPRLILRQLQTSDLDALHAIFSDPITMSFWPAPFEREATERWIARSRQSYAEHGFGRYAVVRKADGALIGDCGLLRAELAGQLENDLGYIIDRQHWRQGYAAEAAGACKAYGFQTLQLRRICANMPADHWASRRTAERIGMTLEREFLNPRNRNILTCLYAAEQPAG